MSLLAAFVLDCWIFNSLTLSSNYQHVFAFCYIDWFGTPMRVLVLISCSIRGWGGAAMPPPKKKRSSKNKELRGTFVNLSSDFCQTSVKTSFKTGFKTSSKQAQNNLKTSLKARNTRLKEAQKRLKRAEKEF